MKKDVAALGLVALILAAVAWDVLADRSFLFASHTTDSVSIDADTTGNSAASLGQIDAATERPLDGTFDVDVVIQNAHNLFGFGFDLSYDPSVINVTAITVNMLLGSEIGSQVTDLTRNFTAPDWDGLVTPAAADFSTGAAGCSSGDGVLVRITLKAVGAGSTDLGRTDYSWSHTLSGL